MDHFAYRELRTLTLQSRILRYRIDVERMQDKPNRFRLSTLEKLRTEVLNRIAGLMCRSSPSNAEIGNAPLGTAAAYAGGV
jgi:hypothetical protein